MKKFWIAAAMALAGATTAHSADLTARPAYTKAPAIDPAYNWTGFYIGANAGYAWGNSNVRITNVGANFAGNEAFFAGPGSPSFPVDGYVIGGQAGYNYQTGRIVLGIEADLDYAHLRGGRTTGILTNPGLQDVSFAERVSADWMLTVRPRIGYAFDRVLVYVTGGLAMANYRFSQILSFPTSFNGGSTSEAKAGWTVGAGLEYAVAGAWSFKAEYLYADFGEQSFRANNSVFVALDNNLTHTANLKENTVRIGVNYRFGGGPIVARY